MSRTVTEPTQYVPNPEMSAMGYLWAALTFVAVLPLLPFIAVGWLLWRLIGPAGGSERKSSVGRRGRTGRPPTV